MKTHNEDKIVECVKFKDLGTEDISTSLDALGTSVGGIATSIDGLI